MVHCFDVEHAKQYGVDEAVAIHSFAFWIRKNRSNGRHFYDGHWWTYNSYAALRELFPYWKTEKIIRRVIGSLTDKGILLRGDYNEAAGLREGASWYAFADEPYFLDEEKQGAQTGTPRAQTGTPASYAQMGTLPARTGTLPARTGTPLINKDSDRDQIGTRGDVTASPEDAEASPSKKASRREPAFAPGVFEAAKAYCLALWGTEPPAWRAEATMLSRLLRAGYSLDDIGACYRHFKGLTTFRDRHLSLTFINQNIAAFRQSKGLPAVSASGPQETTPNGHRDPADAANAAALAALDNWDESEL